MSSGGKTPADYAAVEHLTREAFWNVYRPGCTEHYVVHILRNDPSFLPELDLVMEKDGQLIGHILYVRAKILSDDGREVPVMTFGPISIRPDLQRQGFGKHLLDRSMEHAAALGAGALCIEGNIASTAGRALCPPIPLASAATASRTSPPYFLAKELREGYLAGVTGVYHTPAGYFIDEAEAERFDAAFPPKVKLKLPGQLSE